MADLGCGCGEGSYVPGEDAGDSSGWLVGVTVRGWGSSGASLSIKVRFTGFGVASRDSATVSRGWVGADVGAGLSTMALMDP